MHQVVRGLDLHRSAISHTSADSLLPLLSPQPAAACFGEGSFVIAPDAERSRRGLVIHCRDARDKDAYRQMHPLVR